jgi:formylglycine-generating enzyme required for sulfatase activity
MFHSHFKLLYLPIGLTVIALMGCSNPGKIVSSIPQGTGMAKLMITAAANSPFQKIAKKATLAISASDMLTMSKSLTITDSCVEGTITGIPAGKNRVFSVSVYDSLDSLQYQGSSSVNVIADSTVNVSINVIRITGNANVNGNIIETPAQMKYLPGGTFQMGQVGISDAVPVHSVTLSSFFIDTTEVTQTDYLALMGVNPSNSPTVTKGPVDSMSWFDAVLYCNKRSIRDVKDTVYSYTSVTGTPGNGCTALGGLATTMTKNGYRLPTEAEWEYACRGGTTTTYWWGADTNGMGARAWWTGNSGGTMQPVATTQKNAYGLYDMAGNVWEWCNDWYDSYAATAAIDPMGPATGSLRVFRGGGIDIGAPDLRSAARYYADPAHATHNGNVGFRCVCRL